MAGIAEPIEYSPPALTSEPWEVKRSPKDRFRWEPDAFAVWRYTPSLTKPDNVTNEIEKVISDSSKILTFKGDPEDESFVPCTKDTLDRAIGFLRFYARWMVTMYTSEIPTPVLTPGPCGSIDIHWKNPNKELLVNIPRESNAPMLFYGDDYNQIFIKGSLKSDAKLHPSIMMWLMDF